MKITVNPRGGWCGQRAAGVKGRPRRGLGWEVPEAPWGAGRAQVCPGNDSYPQSTVTDTNVETNTYQQTSKGIPGKAGERQGT